MPFNEHSCADTKPFVLNSYKNGTFNNNQISHYPEKLANLHNCTIRVATSLDADPCVHAVNSNEKIVPHGSDISVIETLAEVLNFHIQYTFTNTQGYLNRDGSAEGPFKELLDKRADLIFDCYWLTKTRLEFLDATMAYYDDYAIIIVPSGTEFSSFEKLIFPFALNTWIVLLSYIAIGVIVIFVIKFLCLKIIQNFVFGLHVNYPMLNLWNALLGGAQNTLPRGNFARFLLMNFLIFSLVIRTAYQGSMYQLIRSNRKHSEMQSIDEIKSENLNFYVLKTTSEMFYNSMGLHGRYTSTGFNLQIWFLNKITIFFRVINVTSTEREKILNQLDKSQFKHTLIMGRYKILHRNFLTRGTSKLILCKEQLMSISIVFYTPKNFYLNTALDDKISLFRSSGLVQFWHTFDKKLFDDKKDSKEPKMLKLHQLKGAFYLWLLGCCGSVFFFIYEFCACKF
jgi:hypothetical protein